MSNDKKRIKIKDIIKNSIYILGIVWKVSKVQFLIKGFFAVLYGMLPMVNILFLRYILSVLEQKEVITLNIQIILIIIGVTLALDVLPNVLAIWQSTLNNPLFDWKIRIYMNAQLFEKLKNLDYECFENPEFYDKYTRSLGRVDSIVNKVFDTFFLFVTNSIGLISLITLIVSMDIFILILAAVDVIIGFIGSIISNNMDYELGIKYTPYSRRHAYLKRILYNPEYAKEVRCNNVLDVCSVYYKKVSDMIIKLTIKYGIKLSVVRDIFDIISGIIKCGMFVYLITGVFGNIYTISIFTALVQAYNNFGNTLSGFFNTISAFYKNNLDIELLMEIFNYKGKIIQIITDKNLCELNNSPYEIKIENLYFKYPNSIDYTLKNISLEIKSGEKIAVVGLNGSGKSTFIKLLLRLYDADKGSILINGNNINSYNPYTIQHNTGVVFQDYQIFAFTVKENIAFDSYLTENTKTALDKMNLLDKIMSISNGFDSVLTKEFSDEGIIMSGGEIQKLCIARALNKNAGLYIFDEPSSALDPQAEYNLNYVMKNMTGGATTIFISHRLSTTVMADKIFLFENGELKESGNHTELMLINGSYAKLFNLQAENYIKSNI